MGCYRPIPAYQEGPDKDVTLWPPLGTSNLALPCSKCIGCKSARAQQWAHRCAHEASRFDNNTFITLTYDEAHLPEDNHLKPAHLQRFIKRLRRHADRHPATLTRDRTQNIRYFGCGEYGDRNQRPHYHLIAFNCDFPDKYKVGTTLYESDTLSTLWPYGLGRFGDATPAAASYIAQYTLKKQGAGDHDADGVWRPAPFLRMSLKPAIGTRWLDQYKTDLRAGYLLENAFKYAIPRTYRTRLKHTDPFLATEIQENLQICRKAIETPAQLAAHEQIHSRLKQLTDHRDL